MLVLLVYREIIGLQKVVLGIFILVKKINNVVINDDVVIEGLTNVITLKIIRSIFVRQIPLVNISIVVDDGIINHCSFNVIGILGR